MFGRVAGALALITAILAGPAAAEILTLKGQLSGDKLVASLGGSAYGVSLPERTTAGGGQVSFALLSFEDALPAGTEVEVWPQVEGDVPPWDGGGNLDGFGRNFWIMDERTGSVAQFDVTKIVSAWDAGTLPNLGFLIRVIQDTGTQQAANLAVTAKEFTLTLHIQPNDPVGGPGGVRKDVRRGKVPRVHDGQ